MTLFHPNLRALRLDSMKTNAKLPTPISSHLLTSLALYGGTGHWSLKRDSVHFPLLEALSLLITHPAPFMAALVAPKLESFDYGSTFQSHSVVFGELADKFSRVHRMSKNVALSTLHFCRAFPRVRHATIDVDNAELLEPYPDNTTFSPAVDHWKELESLTIRGIATLDWLQQWRIPSYDENPFVTHPLVNWFRWRQEREESLLRIKLTNVKVETNGITWNYLNLFATMYDALQGYCTLELEDIPILPCLRFSKSADSPLLKLVGRLRY